MRRLKKDSRAWERTLKGLRRMTKIFKEAGLPLTAGIFADSRKVKKGSIFVATRGQKFDGHDFIREAIQKGAKVIIGETDFVLPKGVKYFKVTDSREVLGQLISASYGNPSQ